MEYIVNSKAFVKGKAFLKFLVVLFKIIRILFPIICVFTWMMGDFEFTQIIDILIICLITAYFDNLANAHNHFEDFPAKISVYEKTIDVNYLQAEQFFSNRFWRVDLENVESIEVNPEEYYFYFTKGVSMINSKTEKVIKNQEHFSLYVDKENYNEILTDIESRFGKEITVMQNSD